MGNSNFLTTHSHSFANRDLLVRFFREESIAGSLAARTQIRPIGNSDVLIISLADPQPQKAMDVVNTLIRVYNEETVEDKNQIAENTLDFVQERLTYLDQELSDVESSEESYKVSSDIPAGLETAVAEVLSKTNMLESEIEALEIQINLMQTLESRLNPDGNLYELLPSGILEEQPFIEDGITRINDLILERESKLRNATVNNPVIKDLDQTHIKSASASELIDGPVDCQEGTFSRGSWGKSSKSKDSMTELMKRRGENVN